MNAIIYRKHSEFVHNYVTMKKDSKIYVAGHTGLLGSAIYRGLRQNGYHNILVESRTNLDLFNQQQVDEWFKKNKPEYVFLAAAQVFGIGANVSGEVILNNIRIQTNVIDAARRNNCKKLLFPGSNCAYPKFPKLPITEDQLLTGSLEPTSESYAVAKIAGIKMCEHFRKQYGFNAITVMPCNLYGPNDTFDLEHAHVMPAMINKFLTAKKTNSLTVTFWGDGSAKREFLYSDDAASACILCMEQYEDPSPINLAPGHDMTLKDLADMIKTISRYPGDIIWDTTKPTGTPAKGLDTTKITNMGWAPAHSLEDGIQKTVDWFEENYQ
jgi:GDP-L-fucose synthase